MAAGKLIGIGVAVLALVGIGGGAAFYFVGGGNGAAEAAQQEGRVEAPPRQISYVPVEPINVPVFRSDNRRYVYSVAISLQISDEKHREAVNNMMPRLRDAFLRNVNSHPLAGQAGTDAIDLDQLKSRLSDQVERVFGPKIVEDVLFHRVIRLMI
ncbi:MAG: flagellar basal body-associated FliL family protein [Alphaproteobacteria bacterium]|nr:flagellar basal body-associated FliL family protein [Alphaproteobacteria bacterium]